MFKKIYNFVKTKINGYRTNRRFQRVERNTRALRELKISDINRWKQQEELLEDWKERVEIIGSMVSPGSRVIEFGAGVMWLKNCLPEGCTYFPTDIVARTPEMQICDLNQKIEIDLEPYDTAVFSGVLEYVYDLEDLFRQLKGKLPTVILSYACSDICKMDRLNKGWLSDYTFSELQTVFTASGYTVAERKDWRSQVILKLKKTF